MENQNERTQEALDLQKYIQDKAKAEAEIIRAYGNTQRQERPEQKDLWI